MPGDWRLCAPAVRNCAPSGAGRCRNTAVTGFDQQFNVLPVSHRVCGQGRLERLVRRRSCATRDGARRTRKHVLVPVSGVPVNRYLVSRLAIIGGSGSVNGLPVFCCTIPTVRLLPSILRAQGDQVARPQTGQQGQQLDRSITDGNFPAGPGPTTSCLPHCPALR